MFQLPVDIRIVHQTALDLSAPYRSEELLFLRSAY
jgi:hypothetical protein